MYSRVAVASMLLVIMVAVIQITPSSALRIDQPTTATYPAGHRFIRIRALEAGSQWLLPLYTAQQVLSMVSDLNPDALERYITGAQNPNAVVPGNPSMTVTQFLDASMKACNCYIIPRISLDEYDKGTLYSTSQNLLSLPVNPPLRILSLDNWTPFFQSHAQAQIQTALQTLYSEGWQAIGVNDCNYSTSFGLASFADFCVDVSTWQPDLGTLSQIQTESSIKQFLLYIDFPGQVQKFMALTPDQEADAITKNIAPAQKSFYFVYPIVQGAWDSNTQITSQSGPYKGASLYTIIKSMMLQYNPSHSASSSLIPEFASSMFTAVATLLLALSVINVKRRLKSRYE